MQDWRHRTQQLLAWGYYLLLLKEWGAEQEVGFWLRHRLVKWREKKSPFGSETGSCSYKLYWTQLRQGCWVKESKKELWAEFRGRNEMCTCCHSLTTPDLPGRVDLNQTGLWPSLDDAGLFSPTSMQSQTCDAHIHVHKGVHGYVWMSAGHSLGRETWKRKRRTVAGRKGAQRQGQITSA